MSLQITDRKYTQDQIDLIKNTVCKGATDDELELFLYTCNRTGLDPLVKQIYAIKRKSGNAYTMTIQTSIDGLRAIAERTRRYSPGQATIFQYNDRGGIISATAFVKKQTEDGTWHEVGATAFFEEYAQRYNGELSKFWKQFPSVMISKCAETLALKRCFPFELSGVHTTEEMMNSLNKSPSESEMLDELEMQKEEVLISPEPVKIELELPDGVDKDLVEQYFIESCQGKTFTVETLKMAAQKNMNKFLGLFYTWERNRKEKK